MRAGKLNKKINIQTRTSVSDGSGGKVTTWETVASVWARRVVRSGYQKTVAEQMESRLDAEWEIRYISGVLPDMRLEAESGIYDIKVVIEDEKKRYLRLLTTEYQSQGG